jgi:hypothetical protein
MSFINANIGKVIYNKVNSTVPCYPVIAQQGTAFPYCVYEVVMNDPEGVKSGVWVDNVTVMLSIYDTTYNSVCTKSNSIRDILNRLKGTTESLVIDTCIYITETDDYDDNLKAYIKIIEYKFRIKN